MKRIIRTGDLKFSDEERGIIKRVVDSNRITEHLEEYKRTLERLIQDD